MSFMVFKYVNTFYPYHSYVKSQASQASRWSRSMVITGITSHTEVSRKIGGYPQKKHPFLDWEFPMLSIQRQWDLHFSAFWSTGLEAIQRQDLTAVATWRTSRWSGRCPTGWWFESPIFCGLNGISWWLFQDFFGGRQVGELWINSPRFMGKWDRNQPEWVMNPQVLDWVYLALTVASTTILQYVFLLMGNTANTANKIYSLRSFAGWFTLW